MISQFFHKYILALIESLILGYGLIYALFRNLKYQFRPRQRSKIFCDDITSLMASQYSSYNNNKKKHFLTLIGIFACRDHYGQTKTLERHQNT